MKYNNVIILLLCMLSLSFQGKHDGYIHVKIKIRLYMEEEWIKYKINDAYMQKFTSIGEFREIGVNFQIVFPENNPTVKEVFETYLVKDEDKQRPNLDPVYTLPFYDVKSVLPSVETRIYQKEFVEVNLFSKEDEVPARFVIYFQLGEGRDLKILMTNAFKMTPDLSRTFLLNGACFIDNERQKIRNAKNLGSLISSGLGRSGYLDELYNVADANYKKSIELYKKKLSEYPQNEKDQVKLEIKHIRNEFLIQYKNRVEKVKNDITNRLNEINKLKKSSEKKKAVKAMLDEYMNTPTVSEEEIENLRKYLPKYIVREVQHDIYKNNYKNMIDILTLVPFAGFPRSS